MSKTILRIGLAALWLAAPASADPKPASLPNLVVILADELGIECLSIYGGKSHHAPNLDELG